MYSQIRQSGYVKTVLLVLIQAPKQNACKNVTLLGR